jgi:hypothetical protein
MRYNHLLLISLLMFQLGSCASLNRTGEAADHAGRLEGIWEVCLAVGRSPSTSERSRHVAGYIAFTRMVQSRRPWMYVGEPSHYGVYTADLAQIGIERDPRIPIPVVGARLAADSVYVVLDPFGSHGPVILHGQLEPSAASGTWFHQAYAFGAEGTFSMKRVEESRLPVPYPVGGPPTPPAIAGCAPT